MLKTISLSLVAAMSVIGCSEGGDVAGPGEAVAQITQVPAQVACVRITVAAPSRSVDRRFDVAAGQSSILNLSGLPVGQVTFTGFAYPSACAAVASSTLPTWISDPAVLVLSEGTVVTVPLLLRRDGSATVPVDFEDLDGGAPVLAMLGQACSTNAACASSFCVDGVCCNSACSGTGCSVCNSPGSLGTCTPAPAGTNPHNTCVAGTCTTGVCDGAGACGATAAGTVCSAPFCMGNNSFVAAGTCNGAAPMCSVPPAVSCGKYACSPTGGCKTSCMSSADCAAGAICTPLLRVCT